MWWNIDRHLTLEDTRRSAYTTYIDSIKTGCTTVFDHHASYCEIEGSLFAIEEVAKELGVRTCLCYEVSDRDGEAKCDAAIQENADFIAHCEKEQDPMSRPCSAATPSSPFRTEPLRRWSRPTTAAPASTSTWPRA